MISQWAADGGRDGKNEAHGFDALALMRLLRRRCWCLLLLWAWWRIRRRVWWGRRRWGWGWRRWSRSSHVDQPVMMEAEKSGVSSTVVHSFGTPPSQAIDEQKVTHKSSWRERERCGHELKRESWGERMRWASDFRVGGSCWVGGSVRVEGSARVGRTSWVRGDKSG